jgi:hypothetical protein
MRRDHVRFKIRGTRRTQDRRMARAIDWPHLTPGDTMQLRENPPGDTRCTSVAHSHPTDLGCSDVATTRCP